MLTQVIAAKSAMNQVGLHIISHSMRCCLAERQEVDPDEFVDDAVAVLLRYPALRQTSPANATLS